MQSIIPQLDLSINADVFGLEVKDWLTVAKLNLLLCVPERDKIQLDSSLLLLLFYTHSVTYWSLCVGDVAKPSSGCEPSL